MAKESLWDGFKRRLGKLGEEAKGWFDANLKDFFKTGDSRPFWMQLLQWVTGGFIKMDAKSLEKNKDDVWTAPRAIFGAAAGIGAVFSHFFAKDEEEEKKAKEATKKADKADPNKVKKEEVEKEVKATKNPGSSASAGEHGFEKIPGVSDAINDLRSVTATSQETKKSHVEKLKSGRNKEVPQAALDL